MLGGWRLQQMTLLIAAGLILAGVDSRRRTCYGAGDRTQPS
jgi:hypothetical protein